MKVNSSGVFKDLSLAGISLAWRTIVDHQVLDTLRSHCCLRTQIVHSNHMVYTHCTQGTQPMRIETFVKFNFSQPIRRKGKATVNAINGGWESWG